MRRLTSAITTLLFALVCAPSRSADAAETLVQPAVDGIFKAFDTHPLVGIGDQHQLANELAFYSALIRDPRFAAQVGNVVVEFGGSQHQDILDRYLDGKNVPYAELSKVWRNMVAHDPTALGVGYQTFFAQVREVNLPLAREKRIRVLLGEPPIDWNTIRTREAWQRIYDQRDSHAAKVITREILDRNMKALVIYGTGHFFSSPWPSTWPRPSAGTETLGEIVQRSHPGAFYLVTPYAGYRPEGCSAAFEARMKWPKKVLVGPIKGTALQEVLMPPGCAQRVEPGNPPIPPEELAQLEKRFYEIDSGAAADALLYLAPAAELMRSPIDATIWMDLDYYKEVRRRWEIMNGEPLWPLTRSLPLYAAPPQPYVQ